SSIGMGMSGSMSSQSQFYLESNVRNLNYPKGLMSAHTPIDVIQNLPPSNSNKYYSELFQDRSRISASIIGSPSSSIHISDELPYLPDMEAGKVIGQRYSCFTNNSINSINQKINNINNNKGDQNQYIEFWKSYKRHEPPTNYKF